jgi:uncharacterized protein YcbX
VQEEMEQWQRRWPSTHTVEFDRVGCAVMDDEGHVALTLRLTPASIHVLVRTALRTLSVVVPIGQWNVVRSERADTTAWHEAHTAQAHRRDAAEAGSATPSAAHPSRSAGRTPPSSVLPSYAGESCVMSTP